MRIRHLHQHFFCALCVSCCYAFMAFLIFTPVAQAQTHNQERIQQLRPEASADMGAFPEGTEGELLAADDGLLFGLDAFFTDEATLLQAPETAAARADFNQMGIEALATDPDAGSEDPQGLGELPADLFTQQPPPETGDQATGGELLQTQPNTTTPVTMAPNQQTVVAGQAQTPGTRQVREEPPLPNNALPSSSLADQVEGPEITESTPVEVLDLSHGQPDPSEYNPSLGSGPGLSNAQFYGGALIIFLGTIFVYLLVRALRMNPLGVDPDQCSERMREYLEQTGQLPSRRRLIR